MPDHMLEVRHVIGQVHEDAHARTKSGGRIGRQIWARVELVHICMTWVFLVLSSTVDTQQGTHLRNVFVMGLYGQTPILMHFFFLNSLHHLVSPTRPRRCHTCCALYPWNSQEQNICVQQSTCHQRESSLHMTCFWWPTRRDRAHVQPCPVWTWENQWCLCTRVNFHLFGRAIPDLQRNFVLYHQHLSCEPMLGTAASL